jgi:hypothetical protein
MSYRISVEVQRRVVLIMIQEVHDAKTLTVLNNYIESRLLPMKKADDIKWYCNKADHFVVMPQTGWEPAELRLEIKRRLGV